MPAIAAISPAAVAASPRRAHGPVPRALRLLRRGLPRFLAVGCGGLATDAAIYSALAQLGATDAVGRAVSLAAATLVTWQLNRRFTFAASGRPAGWEALRYAGVALAAQGLNYALFLALRAAAPEMRPLGALVLCAACAAAFSFTGQALVTFGSSGRFADAAIPLGSRR